MFFVNLLKSWNKISLVKQIIIGLVVGILLALTFPDQLSGIGILGELFVGALKAVAPMLVLFLVMSALSNHKSGKQTNMKSIIGLYLLGTFCRGMRGGCGELSVPIRLTLAERRAMSRPRRNRRGVDTLVMSLVTNPVERSAQR